MKSAPAAGPCTLAMLLEPISLESFVSEFLAIRRSFHLGRSSGYHYLLSVGIPQHLERAGALCRLLKPNGGSEQSRFCACAHCEERDYPVLVDHAEAHLPLLRGLSDELARLVLGDAQCRLISASHGSLEMPSSLDLIVCRLRGRGSCTFRLANEHALPEETPFGGGEILYLPRRSFSILHYEGQRTDDLVFEAAIPTAKDFIEWFSGVLAKQGPELGDVPLFLGPDGQFEYLCRFRDLVARFANTPALLLEFVSFLQRTGRSNKGASPRPEIAPEEAYVVSSCSRTVNFTRSGDQYSFTVDGRRFCLGIREAEILHVVFGEQPVTLSGVVERFADAYSREEILRFIEDIRQEGLVSIRSQLAR